MLSSIHYHILVAIGDDRAHGYAIMQEIAQRTGGKVQILPGTLYSTIKKLVADAMLEECPPPARHKNADERRRYYRTIKKLVADAMLEECPPPARHKNADERRRYYRLTRRGKHAAGEETERLASLVRFAREKGFAPTR